jgi:hypothetical protein
MCFVLLKLKLQYNTPILTGHQFLIKIKQTWNPDRHPSVYGMVKQIILLKCWCEDVFFIYFLYNAKFLVIWRNFAKIVQKCYISAKIFANLTRFFFFQISKFVQTASIIRENIFFPYKFRANKYFANSCQNLISSRSFHKK